MKITIHQRNLQVLMNQVYKIINHIAPPMSSLFEMRKNTHNTRYFQVLSRESRRTVNYGLKTIFYTAPSLWANLPPEYKTYRKLERRKLSMQVMQNVRQRTGLRLVFVGVYQYLQKSFFSFLDVIEKNVHKKKTLNRSQKKNQKIHCNLYYITMRRF